MNRAITFAFAFLAVAPAYALECMDWVVHLQKDHGFWVIPTNRGVQNPSFSYTKIPATELSLAMKTDANAKILPTQEAGKVVIDDTFIHGMEFKDKSCVNAYSVMPDGKFNFDYLICRDMISIYEKKNSLSLLSPEDKTKVAKLVKAANSPPFKNSGVDAMKVYETCRRQVKFLEFTLQDLNYRPTSPFATGNGKPDLSSPTGANALQR